MMGDYFLSSPQLAWHLESRWKLMVKRKNRDGPRKLIDFFSLVVAQKFQDGAGMTGRTQRGIAEAAAGTWVTQSTVAYSPKAEGELCTSTSNSPVKQKRRPDAGKENVSNNTDSISDPSGFDEHLDTFLATLQPILDTILKDMLISLRGGFATGYCLIHETNQGGNRSPGGQDGSYWK